MAKILIVEDDLTFSQLLQGFLQKNNHLAERVNNIKSAKLLLEKDEFDLLLLDYRLPDGTGLEILKIVSPVPAIIMTSFNDVKTAVKAMKSGAFDYITKPVNPEELLMVMNNALNKKEKETSEENNSNLEYIKGNSVESNKLYEYIDLVAPTDMSVLLQGESGTGKENAARTIHHQSKRKNKSFVAIDCGSLSKDLAASELFGHVKGAFTGAIHDKKGQFEVAKDGTLFLDEVGNLSYEVQVKLLRALQEKVIQPLGSNKQIPVNVRIICATNDDLTESVNNGSFREDLYHRINEFKIQLPPLRKRGKDLELFITHFIAQANKELDRNVVNIATDAKQLLLKYDWPGNLRELKNVIKRMVLLTLSNTSEISSLPEEMILAIQHQNPKNTGSDLKAQNEVNEKALIIETLQKVKNNKSQAAKLLNIDRKTLYSKMDKYEID